MRQHGPYSDGLAGLPSRTEIEQKIEGIDRIANSRYIYAAIATGYGILGLFNFPSLFAFLCVFALPSYSAIDWWRRRRYSLIGAIIHHW